MLFDAEKQLLSFVTALAIVAMMTGETRAQSPLVDPLVSQEVNVAVESGKIYHNGEDQELVWTDTVTVPDALWIRLKFDHIILASSPLGGTSSVLKITSLEDGKFQTLNGTTSVQWQKKSAYFNGNSVKLELFAAANGRLNLVQVGTAIAGEIDDSIVARSICDDVDDRKLSKDPRVARGEPIGCSCWLFDDRNNCLITAGHCANGTEVVMFNVPLSDENGDPEFPGPEDQYAVDPLSMQAANTGIGNDWCYFGCFPNANTGLTAFQAQGDSFQLGVPGPVAKGDEIRITGYGSTNFPVSDTWNGAQKTHVGQYAEFSGQQLGYRTDTTGGNSGSPIIFEATGEVIGVHSHGGCSNNGTGMNFGTSILQSAFADALNNPLGVCAPTIDFTYPDGLPEFVAPVGGQTIVVGADSKEFEIDGETAILHVDTGSGFESYPMQDLGDGLFLGSFPPSECGAILKYYFSVASTGDITFTDPVGGPFNFFNAISATTIADVVFSDDFETDQNWSVDGDATAGHWERGIPIGAGDRNDPTVDADGSGSCYLTQNGSGNTDVDGGTTILTSPTIDASLSPGQGAFLSYYRWFNSGASGDNFVVELSNDNGTNWETIETIGDNPEDSTGGWKLVMMNVADFYEPSNQMRIRFSVSDTGTPHIVEAGVDGVSINIVNCDSVLLGDVNLDGQVNLLDVAPFVDLVSSSEYQLEADINGDGQVNLLDVSPFVDLLQN